METELHVLFQCQGERLVRARDAFYAVVFAGRGDLRAQRAGCSDEQFLALPLRDESTMGQVADWVTAGDLQGVRRGLHAGPGPGRASGGSPQDGWGKGA